MPELIQKKPAKKSTGIYLDIKLREEIAALAVKNGVTQNECMSQLLKIALNVINED